MEEKDKTGMKWKGSGRNAGENERASRGMARGLCLYRPNWFTRSRKSARHHETLRADDKISTSKILRLPTHRNTRPEAGKVFITEAYYLFK